MIGVRHETVKHGVGEYVNGMIHTSSLESFWSMLKRGHDSLYHKMNKKHLNRYVAESAGRHNTQELDTEKPMGLLVASGKGKQLRFKDLIAEKSARSMSAYCTATDDCLKVLNEGWRYPTAPLT